MTFYAVTTRFKPGVEDRRNALAQDFMDHSRQPLLHIRLLGVLLGPEGENAGVLMLMEAETRAVVEHFLQSSPYIKAGLYAHIQVDELVIEAGRLS